MFPFLCETLSHKPGATGKHGCVKLLQWLRPCKSSPCLSTNMLYIAVASFWYSGSSPRCGNPIHADEAQSVKVQFALSQTDLEQHDVASRILRSNCKQLLKPTMATLRLLAPCCFSLLHFHHSFVKNNKNLSSLVSIAIHLPYADGNKDRLWQPGPNSSTCCCCSIQIPFEAKQLVGAFAFALRTICWPLPLRPAPPCP